MVVVHHNFFPGGLRPSSPYAPVASGNKYNRRPFVHVSLQSRFRCGLASKHGLLDDTSQTNTIGVGAQSTLAGHDIFARKICMKN